MYINNQQRHFSPSEKCQKCVIFLGLMPARNSEVPCRLPCVFCPKPHTQQVRAFSIRAPNERNKIASARNATLHSLHDSFPSMQNLQLTLHLNFHHDVSPGKVNEPECNFQWHDHFSIAVPLRCFRPLHGSGSRLVCGTSREWEVRSQVLTAAITHPYYMYLGQVHTTSGGPAE